MSLPKPSISVPYTETCAGDFLTFSLSLVPWFGGTCCHLLKATFLHVHKYWAGSRLYPVKVTTSYHSGHKKTYYVPGLLCLSLYRQIPPGSLLPSVSSV